MKLSSYLIFDGNCEEAIHYYRDLLNAELSMVMRYSEAPADMPVEDQMKDKIMHSTLEFSGNSLMASDNPQGNLNPGNNYHLSIYIASEEEAAALYNGLAQDGQVTMPFGPVFWGGKFGMVVDKFGIQWMVSSEHKPA